MGNKRLGIFDVINYTFLLLLMVSILYPFWSLLVVSLSYPFDTISHSIQWYPKKLTLDSYRLVFSSNNIVLGYYNTMYRTVLGTALSIAVSLSAAYALSRSTLPMKSGITIFFLVTLFFSGGMIPSYLLVKELGLLDTRLSLMLPGAVNVFNLVVMRNYIKTSIEPALEESAAIDGATPWQTFIRIVVPLCKPVLATIALWTMVGHWNAWFDAMIYINNPDKQVLQIMLRKIMFNYDENIMGPAKTVLGIAAGETNSNTLKAAFIFVTIGPIVLLYPFLQKYFVKGITIGALKG